jgi:hypothetical protein
LKTWGVKILSLRICWFLHERPQRIVKILRIAAWIRFNQI